MADYTQRTQDKILDFINKAQNKIADLSTDLARSLDEVYQNPEFVEIPIGLLDFIESLLSPHLDWDEETVIDLIDFWMDKAELSVVANLNLSLYQMPLVTFQVGDGITQAQLDAVNNSSINRDNVINIQVETNRTDILNLGTILPASFYDIHDASDVNVWNDDTRLHAHANKTQLDAITADDITRIQALLNHYNNNVAGQKHITEAERTTWGLRLQGITAPGASLSIDVTDPLNPIISYTQQAIAISVVTLLQTTLTSLQDQINAIPAGDTGATPNITIGTVTSGQDETPDVVISGTPEDPVLDFTLKDGGDGIDGSDFVIDVRDAFIERLNAKFSLKTFVPGDVTIGSEEISLNGHDYFDGMRVWLTTDSADLPEPLLENTTYFVTVVDANTITLSTTTNGIPIDLTDTGTGIHSIYPKQDFTYLGSDNGFLYFRLDPVAFPDATLTTGWSLGIQILGENGWSPLLGLFTPLPSTKVIQLMGWSGGSGNKPYPNPEVDGSFYLGATGWVSDVNDATNIQGPPGDSGAKGDMFFPSVEGTAAGKAAYDGQLKDFVYLDIENGLIYKKDSDSNADWSIGYQWRGNKGDPGDDAVAGGDIFSPANTPVNADGSPVYSASLHSETSLFIGPYDVSGDIYIAVWEIQSGVWVRIDESSGPNLVTLYETYAAITVGTELYDLIQAVIALQASGANDLLPPFADLTAIKAYDATSLDDSTMANVDTLGLYRWASAATDTADDDLIIDPTLPAGAGRWYKMSSMINSHASLTNLQGGGVGEYYHLDAAELADVQAIEEVFTTTEQTKLADVEQRANHTGTQAISTITDLADDLELDKIYSVSESVGLVTVNPTAADLRQYDFHNLSITGAGTALINLPTTALVAGLNIHLKDVTGTASANTITIDGGTKNILGSGRVVSNAIVLLYNYEELGLVYDGTDWIIYKTVIDPSSFDAYAIPVDAENQLEATDNWDGNGLWVGTDATYPGPIINTLVGHKHFNNNYFFETTADDVWIRILRG